MRELIRKATDDSQYGKIVGEINAEIDARVRLEGAETAKKKAEAERDEAVRAERTIRTAVGAVRTLFERARGGNPATAEEVSDVLRGIEAMRNERDALETEWNAWREAADAEAAAAGRIEELEAFRNRTSQSPDAVYLDEARKELSWSQAVSETVKAADAAEAALAKWVARAPAKPVVARHPVPWPPFRFQAIVRERMRTWRIPEFDPEDWWGILVSLALAGIGWIVFSFAYREYPISRWFVTLLFEGVAALVSLGCLFDGNPGEAGPKPTWRPFRRFLELCVAGWMLRHWFEWPLFGWAATAAGAVCLLVGLVKGARAGARKRVRRELLDARAKWLSEEIAKRWPDSETEKRWNALTSNLEPLSRQRAACLEPGTADSVRFYRWRVLWNRLESLRAWDAVHAQWDVRRQALRDESSDRVRDVRDAVDAVVRDAVQLLAMHHERTAAAEEAVEMAVAAAEKSAAAFPAAVASARAAAETAAHGADAARRAWEAAKAATDAAVAKEEEKEKRRVEARIEFARLKDRTVPAIRAKLERIRLSEDVTKALFERIVSAESELASWEARKDPLPEGLPAERHFAEEADGRAAAFEREWIGLRHARADKRLGAAAKAFGGGRLDDCIAAADECLALEPGRGEAEELRRKAIEAIESREKEIEDWKTDAAEKIQNVHPGSDEPSRSVYEKMTECNERLRSFSSWKDRGRAHNEYNHICGGVRILEGIGQIAEARESFRKRKAEAEESAKAWRVCIPETLYPASARSSDEVWKRADSEAARGATESAKTEYERAARCAEDALRDWKKVVPDAYLAMARAADKPRGSNRLSRWIAQTVLDSSDVAIFKPLKNPETWTGEFACPWMPEGLFERFVSLPRPRDVLFAMGDPKAAGEWLADLFRFFEEASRIGSPAGWRRDQEVENHRKTLEEYTRKLMVGMAMRQDELLGRMHENIAWFKAAEPIREAREARREAADRVERAGRLGTLSEEVRRSFDSRLEEVAELVGQSQWEKARQKATEIRNDAENRIKAFSVERETKRSNAFRNWLERNPCISRESLVALGEILRSPPFDAVAELPERRSLSIRLLGRCQDHALVRLMQDDGSIDADLLAEAVRVVLDAPEPKLVDWFQTMPTAELQWNVGMHSPRNGKLNRLLWMRSAESGFPQGRSSWRWLQQHDLVAP